jgi:hypothetical protein
MLSRRVLWVKCPGMPLGSDRGSDSGVVRGTELRRECPVPATATGWEGVPDPGETETEKDAGA